MAPFNSPRRPPISERTTRVNIVEISVIVPKKTAAMSPIMVQTWGSATVIISSVSLTAVHEG